MYMYLLTFFDLFTQIQYLLIFALLNCTIWKETSITELFCGDYFQILCIQFSKDNENNTPFDIVCNSVTIACLFSLC